MPSKLPTSITTLEINNSDAALLRPVLAVEASRIFAKWANVEFVLANTVAMILGDMAALAILDQIKAKNNQYDAIKNAIKERARNDKNLDLLNPLFKLLTKAAEPRNKLAHSLWGVIDELPTALLLTEPKTAVRFSRFMLHENGSLKNYVTPENKTTFERSFSAENDTALEMIELLRSGIEVWEHEDFEEPQQLIASSIIALQLFTSATSPSSDTNVKNHSREDLLKVFTEKGIKV